MKRRPAFLLILSLFAISACAQQSDMTIENLLDRNADARGGKAAIEAVNTVEIDLHIVEPKYNFTANYRATRDGFMRIDVFADGTRVFTESLGPNGGWQMFGDGDLDALTPEGESALERGVIGNLYGLHELPSLGYTLELIGAAERNGGQYWEVEKTAPDGFSEHLFFDKDTFLVVSSIETSALHPDIDLTEVRQETFNIEHRETAGVLFGSKTEKRNLETGDIMQTVTVTARRMNEQLDPSQFERPAAAE